MGDRALDLDPVFGDVAHAEELRRWRSNPPLHRTGVEVKGDHDCFAAMRIPAARQKDDSEKHDRYNRDSDEHGTSAPAETTTQQQQPDPETHSDRSGHERRSGRARVDERGAVAHVARVDHEPSREPDGNDSAHRNNHRRPSHATARARFRPAASIVSPPTPSILADPNRTTFMNAAAVLKVVRPVRLSEAQGQPATIVAASAIRWSLVQGGPSVARGPCRTSSARSASTAAAWPTTSFAS